MSPRKARNSAQLKISNICKRRKGAASTETKSTRNVGEDDNLTHGQMEQVLREFDLNMAYGPFLGISRLARLERAERFALPVDARVGQILHDRELLETQPELNLNIWHDMDSII